MFLFSSLVNFLFDALLVARRSIGELSHDLISFEDVKILADVFISHGSRDGFGHLDLVQGFSNSMA
jgi:hypothetical protein